MINNIPSKISGMIPLHKCNCLAIAAYLVTPIMGHLGPYLETICADFPVVVTTIMAAANDRCAASTAANPTPVA